MPTAIAFALHLRRTSAPLVDVGLLAQPRFGLGMASTTAVMIAYGGFLFVLTLHLQEGLGDSPLRSGLTFAPYALGFAVASLTAPRWLAPFGLAASAISYAGLGLVADGAWSDAEALPLLALAGAGFGAGYSQVITRAIAGVPPARAHDASGLFNTINMLGFALGVATLGSAYLSGASLGTITELCGALSAVAVGFVLLLGRAERPLVSPVVAASETMAA